MSYRDRSKRTPHLPPVTKIILSEDHLRLRLAVLVLVLVIAFIALGVGLMEAFTSDPGWKTMDCHTEEMTYRNDISLQYYLGSDGQNATTQERAVNAVYGRAMEEAYRLFNSEVLQEGNHNIAYLNAHPNEVVTVEPALYQALTLLEKAQLRYAYLAPLYAEYHPIFLSDNDVDAARFDPARNQDQAADIRQLADLAADAEMTQLELLGDNQVCLRVSEEYLAFAQEYGFTDILDLSWMTNAFVVDYVADRLIEAGHTAGYLVSYDGFTRNLGGLEEDFALNLFARQGSQTQLAGTMTYSGTFSVAVFRDYPVSATDRWHYRCYEDGGITSIYLDPADGMSKGAVSDLVVYARDLSCAALMLRGAQAFIADSFSDETLSDVNMGAIWSVEDTIFYSQADASITMMEGSGMKLRFAE